MSYPYDGADLRKHPEAYRVGRGEQGVFHAEPYKGELLPLWSFKTEAAARDSSERSTRSSRSTGPRAISSGWTSPGSTSRWGGPGRDATPSTRAERRASPAKRGPGEEPGGEVFREKWRAAAEDEEYLRLKEEHRRRNE
jgi:hypothetical protein